MDATTQNAYTFLLETFRQYGLESLAGKIMGFLREGYDQATIPFLLRDTEEYKARFPAMEELSRKGVGFDEASYVNFERNALQQEQRYGLPKGMLSDPGRVRQMLVNDIDADDLNARVAMNAAAAQDAPQDLKDALRDYYGLDEGSLTAYYLDPDNSLSLLQRQSAAARVGQYAREQNLAVDRAKAEALAAQGYSEGQLREGMATAAALSGLGLSQDTLMEAGMGDVAAQRAVREVQTARQAQFQGGGGAAETQQGVTGLRSSNR
jgi:hypothetical protein